MVQDGTMEETREVVDPVCGEIFPPDLSVFRSTRGGRTVHFCSSTCKADFDAHPDAYRLVDPEGTA